MVGSVSTSRRFSQSFCVFVIVALLLGTNSTVGVTATPIGDNCNQGLMVTDSNIDITRATINMSIASAPTSSEYLLHTITVDGRLEMTNTDIEN